MDFQLISVQGVVLFCLQDRAKALEIGPKSIKLFTKLPLFAWSFRNNNTCYNKAVLLVEKPNDVDHDIFCGVFVHDSNKKLKKKIASCKDSKVVIKSIPPGKYVKCFHKGSHKTIGTVFPKIVQFCQINSIPINPSFNVPCVSIYHNSLKEVSAQNLLTEIWWKLPLFLENNQRVRNPGSNLSANKEEAVDEKLVKFLQSIHLGKYLKGFVEEEIIYDDLVCIKEEDLVNIFKEKKIHLRRFMKNVNEKIKGLEIMEEKEDGRNAKKRGKGFFAKRIQNMLFGRKEIEPDAPEFPKQHQRGMEQVTHNDDNLPGAPSQDYSRIVY